MANFGSSRRDFLKWTFAAAAQVAGSKFHAADAAEVEPINLRARPGLAHLLGTSQAPTPIWGFNGQSPGPILRVRQGDELRVRVTNELQHPTSVHWHGIRIVNSMDGVPGMTQEAIKPGSSFDYRFACPDAGTFWYHPHIMSSEQVARGLHGILIVEEPSPPQVDQDLVFVVDDWRLSDDGKVHGSSFGSIGERAHGGRIGNTFTLNGTSRHAVNVTSGERLRLRLCSVSNANTVALRIKDHAMRIIAIDGQPIEPIEAAGGYVFLASGQRADVIVDMMARPGTTSPISVIDLDGERGVGQFVYHRNQVLRAQSLTSAITLPPNPLNTRFDLANAKEASLSMDGGAMGGMSGAQVGDQWFAMRELIDRYGFVWSFNGIAGMPKEPLFKVEKGRTVKLHMANRTGWPHAMHIHGHHFKQISRKPSRNLEPFWRDTILVNPREEFVMAFAADNPGKWMLHCHMLEHQEGGMATWFQVDA